MAPTTPSSTAPTPPVSRSYGSGPAAYLRLLSRHAAFRTLWLGELLNSAGGWFAYVATLRRVAELAAPSQQGRLLSAVLLTHYVPALLTFPVAGVLADSAPRELVLAGSCVVGAAAAAALTLVRGPDDLFLMLALLVVQHSSQSIYEPTKRALLPALLPAGDSEALRLATTLDSVGWSLMGAFGSSAGGLVLGAFGYSVNYALDAASYLAAGAAALSLRGRVRPRGGGSGIELPARNLKSRPSDTLEGVEPPPPPSPALATAFASALASALADVRAGFRYVTHPAHRAIAVISLVKAGGAVVWGAADVLNVKVSELPAAQGAAAGAAAAWARLAGAAASPPPTPDALAASVLGAIFACVGVGCLVGPLAMNALTGTDTRSLLRAVGAAFALLAAGYAGLAASGGALAGVMAATALRSAGSATLWTYSSLLLQLSVPDALLGRVSSLEQAAFTVGECVSAGGAGLLFDVAGASVRGAAFVMSFVAAGVAALWWRWVVAGVPPGSLPSAAAHATASHGSGGGLDAEAGTPRAQRQQQQQD